MENKSFNIKFSKKWFDKNDILLTPDGARLLVLETPHKKWYKQLLQFISFKLYMAPTMYKVKLIK